MLNKIQEKVSFIESFSVHELLEVPVEKVSVAAIHFLYQLLDAVPVGLYVLCMCPVRCYKTLWVIDHVMFKPNFTLYLLVSFRFVRMYYGTIEADTLNDGEQCGRVATLPQWYVCLWLKHDSSICSTAPGPPSSIGWAWRNWLQSWRKMMNKLTNVGMLTFVRSRMCVSESWIDHK